MISKSECGIPSKMYVRTPPPLIFVVDLCLKEATLYPGIFGILPFDFSHVSCIHIMCGFIFISSIWLLSSGRLITLWEFHCRIISWDILFELLETVSIIEDVF